jgi:hypothetical protein
MRIEELDVGATRAGSLCSLDIWRRYAEKMLGAAQGVKNSIAQGLFVFGGRLSGPTGREARGLPRRRF